MPCHVGSHSVTCHPAKLTFLPLPQTKLVLDLATSEGCKAELTQKKGEWLERKSHSFIPGVKPSFGVNPSHHSLPFPLQG